MSAFPTGPNPVGNVYASGIAGQAAAERAAEARNLRQQASQQAARRDFRDTYQGLTDVEAADAADHISDEQQEATDERKRKRREQAAQDQSRTNDAEPGHLDLRA